MSLFYFLEDFMLTILPVLINVAFLTLLERKILGLGQLRVGPNKVGLWGILQPAADAVKLFTNSVTMLGPMNKVIFFFSPIMSLLLSLMFAMLISSTTGGVKNTFSLLMLMVLLSLNVYPLFGAGWSSNSKYAMIGGLRGIAQTVAYEISLSFILVSLFLPSFTTNLSGMSSPTFLTAVMFFNSFVFILWLLTVLAELNRTPFDFAEGESELVSGFNIEYGSIKFAMIFMAEYAMIFIFSVLSVVILLSIPLGSMLSALLAICFSSIIILSRVTLPRFRYDLLMNTTWKKALPWGLGLCGTSSGILLLLSLF